MESTKQVALKELTDYLVKSKATVLHTVLRHVSASGMQREISVKLIGNNDISHLDYLVSQALGLSQGQWDGIKVRGCGMDMGFHLVDSINRATGLNLRQEWI